MIWETPMTKRSFLCFDSGNGDESTRTVRVASDDMGVIMAEGNRTQCRRVQLGNPRHITRRDCDPAMFDTGYIMYTHV